MVTVYLGFNRIWKAFVRKASIGRPVPWEIWPVGCGGFGGGGGLVCQFKSPRSCVYLVLPAGKDTGLGLSYDVEQ